jgi:hypothetical protein
MPFTGNQKEGKRRKDKNHTKHFSKYESITVNCRCWADTQPQDPQPPQSPLDAPPGDLVLPLHPHPIVEPGPQPPQVEPIPTQADTVPKVLAIRREVRRVFQEEDEAWAARVSKYTMQESLFALL